jgi:ATP-dependent DNA ligase
MFMGFPHIAALFDATPFIEDVDYCAEEMLNGQRLLVSKHGRVVRAFTRDRIEHFLPLSVLNLAHSFPGDFVLDGELVHESFIAFDLLSACGVDVCGETLLLRQKLLANVAPFPLAATAMGERAKARLIGSVHSACGAGVVFKRLDAPYNSGHDTYGIRFSDYLRGSRHSSTPSIEKCRVAGVESPVFEVG